MGFRKRMDGKWVLEMLMIFILSELKGYDRRKHVEMLRRSFNLKGGFTLEDGKFNHFHKNCIKFFDKSFTASCKRNVVFFTLNNTEVTTKCVT